MCLNYGICTIELVVSMRVIGQSSSGEWFLAIPTALLSSNLIWHLTTRWVALYNVTLSKSRHWWYVANGGVHLKFLSAYFLVSLVIVSFGLFLLFSFVLLAREHNRRPVCWWRMPDLWWMLSTKGGKKATNACCFSALPTLSASFYCNRLQSVTSNLHDAKLRGISAFRCLITHFYPSPGFKRNVSCLQELVSYGVGFHHAGLDVRDRHAVENMFIAGELPVLCKCLRDWSREMCEL